MADTEQNPTTEPTTGTAAPEAPAAVAQPQSPAAAPAPPAPAAKVPASPAVEAFTSRIILIWEELVRAVKTDDHDLAEGAPADLVAVVKAIRAGS